MDIIPRTAETINVQDAVMDSRFGSFFVHLGALQQVANTIDKLTPSKFIVTLELGDMDKNSYSDISRLNIDKQ